LGCCAIDRFELARKKEWILVAQRPGNFPDAHVVRLEQLAGLMDAEADEKVDWRATGFLSEEGSEMRGRKIGQVRQLRHRHPFIEVL
jgi:hypothetical protein